MRALFVGIGSIGKRHLKNLKFLLPSVSIEALRSSTRVLDDDIAQLIEKQHTATNTLSGRFDICFITCPTAMHYRAIQDTKGVADSFFVEKPIFGSVSKLPFYTAQKVYVAAPMRFSKVFYEFEKALQNREYYAARAICSSFLPSWRADTDYHSSYSAKKEEGGGVRLDLIHEWDYLKALFGAPTRIAALSGNFSNLNISSEDGAVYIAKTATVMLSLHLDYFGKEYTRRCEVFCEDGTLTADFGGGYIQLPGGKRIDCSEDGNDKYLRELKAFLEYIGGGECKNTAENAMDTLKTALSGDIEI